MIYIKTYESFDSSNLKDDIEDICQDIKDDGMDVFINFDNKFIEDDHEPYVLFKKLSSEPSRFPMSSSDSGSKQYAHPISYLDVEGVINRIKSYLDTSDLMKFWYVEGFRVSTHGWDEITNFEDDEFYAISVRLKIKK